MNNNSIFSQAKIEYTKQLIDILIAPIYDKFMNIYNESKILYSKDTNIDIIHIFRDELSKIPTWNNTIIEEEVETIINISNCDWIDDLITAVFISNTKILASLNTNQKKINLIIPKTVNFIHKCYINIARELWKNPYLFDTNTSGYEQQQNIKSIEIIIKESIEFTIRKLIPLKDIIKDQFDENEPQHTKELRELLVDELKNLKNEIDDKNDNEIDDKSDNEINDNNVIINNDNEINDKNDDIDETKIHDIDETKIHDNEINDKNDDIDGTRIHDNEITDIITGVDDVNKTLIGDSIDNNDTNITEKDINNIELNNMDAVENTDNIEDIYDNVDIIQKDIDSNLEDDLKDDLKVYKSITKPNQSNIEYINTGAVDNYYKPYKGDVKIVKEDDSSIPDSSIPDSSIPEPEPDNSVESLRVNSNKDTEPGQGSMSESKLDQSNLDSDRYEGNPFFSKDTNFKEYNIKKSEIDDDTETLDNFYNDVVDMVSKKGVLTEKETDKFTLFDDAPEYT